MAKGLLLLCITLVIFALARGGKTNLKVQDRKITILDNFGFFVLEWELDLEDEEITFIVSVLTKGYIGLGISNDGNMAGSDIVIGGIKEGSFIPYFEDRHGVDNHGVPELDEIQDWKLLGFHSNLTHTVITAKRKFDTGDEYDVPIIPGVTKVIWAYGFNNDLKYHGTNRGLSNIELITFQ